MLRSTTTFLSCLVAIAALPAQAQTPNVLLVVADDVGVDGIACYGLGSNPANTPTIDDLAADGVLFLNAQACPLCSPTRASILTGRHGFRTGIGTALVGAEAGLDPSEVTLPELLEAAGVDTALIGKWHLGEDLGWQTPTAEGFGTFVGLLGGALSPGYYNWQKVDGGPPSTSTTYATTDLVDEALAFVAGATEPWFLMLSFNAGHTPYHVPPSALHTVPGLSMASPAVDRYRASVEAMDTELGRFLSSIPAATLAATNIVFCGDNGTASAVVEAPFISTQSKGTVYQGGVRVPLIVAGPVVGGAPRTESALVHAVDLFATIAAVQGVDVTVAVPATVTLDGVDASSLLAAALQPPVRRYSYSQEFSGTTAMATSGDSEMMRGPRYSLLRFQGGTTASTITEEMYDLVVDPFETTNLLPLAGGGLAAAAYRSLKRELARLRGYPWSGAYGAGCSFCGVSPMLTEQIASSPVIGSSWQLEVRGLTASVPATLAAIGFQNETFGGLSLPLSLAAVGAAAACSLRVDPVLIPLIGPATPVASLPIVLPNDPAIVGAELHVQAFPLLTGCAATWLLATNAFEAVIGT